MMETPKESIKDPGSAHKTSYSLFLFPKDGGAFKTDDGSVGEVPEQWYREHCAVEITCNCLRIIHGRRNPDAKNLATLIVLELRFFPNKMGRRITWANLRFTFRGSHICPKIVNIAPDAYFSVAPSIVVWEASKKLQAAAGVTLPAIVNLNLLLEYGLVTKGETESSQKVWGNRVVEPAKNPLGHMNQAYWTLWENKSQSSSWRTSSRRRTGRRAFRSTHAQSSKAQRTRTRRIELTGLGWTKWSLTDKLESQLSNGL
ncbi:hypothetical protein B0T14DRAFT_512594 [Immersiella caudata]|uniref:Uncharacterized protein n=1 Tax=Immersiella caudata TaxID=314043 RepID=A0AA40C732_9PEZI|nr:hypothetical protein B0T14DRAFT_512594 [Immersiella caudata]